MVIFNHANVKGENIESVILGEESQEVTCPKVLNKYFETYCLSTSCKMFYKRELIIKNNIIFDKTISYGEDMLFSITAYLCSNRTYYLNYCGYFYVSNRTSATCSKDIEKRKKHCYDNLKLYEKILVLLKEKGEDVDKYLFLDAFLRNFLFGLNSLWSLNEKGVKQEIKEILGEYQKYIVKYKAHESILNKKMKLELIFLKKGSLCFLDLYFMIKKMLGKIK